MKELLMEDIFYQEIGSISKGTNPSSTAWVRSYKRYDKNGTATANRITEHRACVNTDGSVDTENVSWCFTSGSTAAAVIGIKCKLDGTGYAYCPNPPAADNTNSIATTKWVNDKGYLTEHQSLSNYVTLNGNQTISGQKTFTANQFFTSGIYQRNNNYTLGNTVTANQVITYSFVDSANAATGYCRSVVYKTSNLTSTEITARNKIKNGALDTTGDVVTSQFFVRVESNGTKYIVWDGSVKNNIVPYATNTHNLGSSTAQWNNTYTNKLYLNGTEFKISDIPTKTSDLTNDSGFLTSHQSLNSRLKDIVINQTQIGKLSYYGYYSDSTFSSKSVIISNSISLPDLDNREQVTLDTTNWVNDGSAANTFTPTKNGWLQVKARDAAGNSMFILQGQLAVSNVGTGSIQTTASYKLSTIMPVTASTQVQIFVKANAPVAFFFPCMGVDV